MILKKFFNALRGIRSIDDNFYDELEETLILADIGVETTEEIIEDLKEAVKEERMSSADECEAWLKKDLIRKMELKVNAFTSEKVKSVYMLIGVNGVGKTTTCGKLACSLRADGRKVLLAAADTFRAAAIDQLQEWANRAQVDMIGSTEGSDPGAVVYDACSAAKARDVDVLICDTAGRLHNKKNLMAELKKLYGIIDREYPQARRETLVVLDATTGQNAIEQARQFSQIAQVTGIVLTKMDGTAKGGIAVAIHHELGIPVKYIGYGEKVEDLKHFDPREYVEKLFEADK